MVRHTATSVVTIERFIIEQERQHPEATGELSGILYDIALAAKMIASKVRMAGLADMALAIIEGRPHRCSMESALHAVDVMTGVLKSGETGKFVSMQ